MVPTTPLVAEDAPLGGRDPLPEPDRPVPGTGGGCGYYTCSGCQVDEPLVAQ